jgi:hypothetical protein
VLSADEPLSVAELDAVASDIDRWAAAAVDESEAVSAVERDPGDRRWYVRILGEDKDTSTIRLHLGQRTLRYETYLMPAPEGNEAELYRYLLARNLELGAVTFAIGEEEAVFLVGHLAADRVTEAALDRVVGGVYAAVERCFRSALRIGFPSRAHR